MTNSGFIISISEGVLIIPAVISPGPVTFRFIFLTPSECIFKDKDLIFKTISVTSSRTPSIEENSWSTLSILIAVTAVPCKEDKRTLLKALPKVNPKPLSRGSATKVALYCEFSSFVNFNLDGLINVCQLFIILMVIPLIKN